MHGDTHTLGVERPWSDVPNFTRVESDGPGSDKWVRITVDAASPGVFSFAIERGGGRR